MIRQLSGRAAFVIVALTLGCQQAAPTQAAAPPTKAPVQTKTTPAPDKKAVKSPKARPTQEGGGVSARPVDKEQYAWMASWPDDLPELTTLEGRFAPPEGFARVPASKGSFAAWLRGLPVRLDRTGVQSFRGDGLSSPSAAVVLLDVGSRDLQQCADMAIRLRAEYLWSAGKAKTVQYDFTSGDLSTWSAWKGGERFKIAGNKVERKRGKARKGNHQEFRRYLDNVFRYAGTRSLARDSKALKDDQPIEPGDFFVQPGGPGHAVVVLDVVEHEDGRRAALIGQGFMPAQDFHVVTRRGADVLDAVWFVLPKAGQTLDTPSWSPFERSEARRWTR